MFDAFSKLMGLDIPAVQDVPTWIPETREQLLAITTPPKVPIPVWDVMAGGLNDGALVDTNNAILDNTKLMRARLAHITRAFHALNLPLTYATHTMGEWLRTPKRAAEQSLLYRFQRSQGGARNWETPGNTNPINTVTGQRVDFAYEREVALARNHIHTAAMWEALAAMAPPPEGPVVYGYVLPLTPQEVAVSQQAAAEKYVEPQLRGAKVTYALYPHLASTQTPGLSPTYLKLTEYAKKQMDALASRTNIGTREQILAARKAANEWQAFWLSLDQKWGHQGASPLYAKDAAARSAQQAGPTWQSKHDAQKAAWIAAHPEIRGELAHAKTLIYPHQQWLNWLQGAPYSRGGADGTRLGYLVALEAGKPLKMQIACQEARTKAAQQAAQRGQAPATYPASC